MSNTLERKSQGKILLRYHTKWVTDTQINGALMVPNTIPEKPSLFSLLWWLEIWKSSDGSNDWSSHHKESHLWDENQNWVFKFGVALNLLSNGTRRDWWDMKTKRKMWYCIGSHAKKEKETLLGRLVPFEWGLWMDGVVVLYQCWFPNWEGCMVAMQETVLEFGMDTLEN